jgi:signal peptidase I
VKKRRMNKRLVVLGVFLILMGVGGIAWSMSGAGLYEVQSGSMEPSLYAGDVVVAADVGEVETGDVILWDASGDRVIIHRVAMDVQKGENWVQRADSEHLGDKTSCRVVALCPAPESGFITLGDNKGSYDQINARFSIVTESDIRGEPIVVWER